MRIRISSTSIGGSYLLGSQLNAMRATPNPASCRKHAELRPENVHALPGTIDNFEPAIGPEPMIGTFRVPGCHSAPKWL
jgi:hypothetical protein